MKPMLIALVAATLVALAAAGPGGDWSGFPRKRSLQKRDSQANINDYMDQVLDNTVNALINGGLEPYDLADKYVYNFTFKDPIGISWKTRLGLYDGQAQNLSTLHRESDAVLSYTSEARTINLNAIVAFDRLVITYHYAAQTLNLGPSGTFTATLKNLTANLDISVNLKTFNATLNDFQLNTAKSIKVKVTGLTLLGNLAVDSFINVFLIFLKGPILNSVESAVRGVLETSVAQTSAGNISISTS